MALTTHGKFWAPKCGAVFVTAALTFLLAQPQSQAQAHPQSTAQKAKQIGKSGEPDNAAGSAQAANGAAPGQPTAPKPVTAAHLAALPKPLPESLTQGIDVQARSRDVLQHLSDVIRFYRETTTPIQKVGEPSDVLYEEQAQSVATQIAQLAFQAARDQAALYARIQGATGAVAAPAEGEAQKLANARTQIAQQIQQAQQQTDELDAQMAKARGKARADLDQQKNRLAGQIQLLAAAQEALQKVAGLSASQANTGLEGDIDKLQHSVPEVIDNKVKPVATTMQSIGSMREAGVVTQAQVLFQLISTEHTIDQRQDEIDKLHQQATALRSPLINILRATFAEGKRLQQQAATEQDDGGQGTTGTQSDKDIRKQFDQLTDAYKSISGVAVPISQELLLLEQAKGNSISWRGAVDAERKSVLHDLLIRIIIIAFALGVVFVLGEVWRRAVTRYVQDLRRRRQLLVIRRMAMGFLTVLVILLGFITQFSSLATFAGFITAGLAVGLQSVLLSVAAYFFIVGRYGIRVGDRITVANVTGDVVEVGLVRFYLMELAGTGSQLHPTGRIAVFANSVLFQTGTPLYKQIPGTNYAWHEVTVKLKPGTRYEPALEALTEAVQQVYSKYQAQIQRQHSATEAWMDTTLPSPQVESRLQLTDGVQASVLYPVDMSRSVEIDQQVVEKLLDVTAKNENAAQAIDGAPVLKRL